MAQFSSILENAPTKVAYWAFVGYGWSFFVWGHPLPRYATLVLGSAILVLYSIHLYLRIPELQLPSDRQLTLALPLADTNPKAYTEHLAKALRLNPHNESVNYRYAVVLGKLHREEEAVQWIAFIQTFAPDSNQRSI